MNMRASVLKIERPDFEAMEVRVQRAARRDAALIPADRKDRIDAAAWKAIDQVTGIVLDVEHPPLAAWMAEKLWWTYIASFAEARAQMMRWPR
jgi:hypothetical protein